MKKRTISQVEKKIDKVYKQVNKKIAGSTQDNIYSKGLAYEGYLGGYVQALADVGLFIRGVTPNANDFWKEEK